MALDKTAKARNLIARAIAVAERFDADLTAMGDIVAEAGFVGTITTETLDLPELSHLEPADVVALNAAFTALNTYMAASNRRDIYRKAKR